MMLRRQPCHARPDSAHAATSSDQIKLEPDGAMSELIAGCVAMVLNET
jgi:hypothetical protein